MIRADRIALLWAGGMLCVSCDNPASAPTPAPAAIRLVKISGDSQSAMHGSVLPRPLQVQLDSAGIRLVGRTVAWHPSSGMVVPASSVTDEDGLAVASWVLGAAAGPVATTVTADGATGSPVRFSATALPVLTMSADLSTDGQQGNVGASLLKQLRVVVLADGVPAPGVAVSWQAGKGRIVPVDPLTDASGAAVATLNLATVPGVDTILASAAGVAGSPVRLTATGRAGPPAQLQVVAGNGQSAPADFPEFKRLGVRVADRYGNGVPDQAVEWSVLSGPVTLLDSMGTTDPSGMATAVAAPTGTPGTAIVVAAVPGGPGTNITLEAAEPVPSLVIFDADNWTFRSARNGSVPAVDTVAAGTTVTWYLLNFDYDYHGVWPDGTPSFTGGGSFGHHDPYSGPLTVTATFTASGTYQYVDSTSGARGTVVAY